MKKADGQSISRQQMPVHYPLMPKLDILIASLSPLWPFPLGDASLYHAGSCCWNIQLPVDSMPTIGRRFVPNTHEF
jgi:hypothetical protein